MAVYDEIMAKYREAALTGSIIAIMGWDMECYIPPKGYPLRGQQLGLLSQMRQRMLSSPELGKLLEKAESETEYKKLDEIPTILKTKKVNTDFLKDKTKGETNV